MIRKILFSGTLILLAGQASSQTKPISKLELKAGEVYQVGPTNQLNVDTLILHDKATIRFLHNSNGVLYARAAFIGKECLVTAKGTDGKNGNRAAVGTNGQDGGNLEVNINFVKLGSLVIDTRGGNGGDGYTGKNGDKPKTTLTPSHTVDKDGKAVTVYHRTMVSTGTKGEVGRLNGIGGNGGNLTFTYSTTGFVLNFNHTSQSPQRNVTNQVEILYQAGKLGKAGKDGNSYVGTNEAGTTVITGAPVSAGISPATTAS